MNSDRYIELVTQAQAGNADAMEQLLLRAQGPVACFANKLLQNEEAAAQITREVLEIICHRLDSLPDPASFRKWLGRITAARCMRTMPLSHHSEERFHGEEPWLAQLRDDEVLTEAQSSQVIQQMVDSLPRKERLFILLLGCGGLRVSAIAQMTGFSEATVGRFIQQGQSTIQRHLWELEARNIQFTGLSSLTGILQEAMFRAAPTEDALVLVYDILGKKLPQPKRFSRWIVRLLWLILILELAAIAAVGGYLVMQMMQ